MTQYSRNVSVIISAWLLAACFGSIRRMGEEPEGSDEEPPAHENPESEDEPLGGAGAPGRPNACARPDRGGRSTWRRLTSTQYRNAIRDLLGVSADVSGFLLDSKTGPFSTNARLPVQDSDIDAYAAAASRIASQAVSSASLFGACDVKAKGESACADAFIEDLGSRAFRRPLVAAQRTALRAAYDVGREEDYKTGLRAVIEAVVSSPSFLYMIEAPAPPQGRSMDAFELATRLSFALGQSTPDATLWAAARDGSLLREAVLLDHARRLLASPQFLDAATTFVVELAEVDGLARDGFFTKEAGRFPEFDAALRGAMLSETRQLARRLFDGSGSWSDGTWQSLLASPEVVPVGPLAKVYGLPQNTSPVEVKDGSRSGLLTQASVLGTHPRLPTHYGAVIRGHFIRRNLLCQTVPPPQVAVEFKAPPNADKMSSQELLRAHRDNPTCRGCHELMDPLGFAFEGYDVLGRTRKLAADGSPIDTSGAIVGSDVDGTFARGSELVEKLAASGDVRACAAEQWFRFVLGRDVTEDDACARQRLTDVLSEGKGDMREALVALVSSASFRMRKGQ